MSSSPSRPAADLRGPVLVTGATGFVGGHLVRGLVERNVEVCCLARESSDTLALEELGVRVERISIERPSKELTETVSGYGCVVHVAGAVRALTYDGFLRVNAVATQVLAEACIEAEHPPRRFVLVSSVGATGPAPPGERLTEGHAPGERTDYGRSKWDGEQRLLALAGRLPSVILRPTAIYGPRDREMLPVLRLANAGWLPAFAGPDQIYNLAHVEDVVRGVLRACTMNVFSGDIFLLGGPREYTTVQLAEVMGQALGRRVRVLPLPRALLWCIALLSELFAAILRKPAMLNRQKIPELTGSWRLDLSRSERELGHVPRIDLPKGLEDTVRWYRKQGLL